MSLLDKFAAAAEPAEPAELPRFVGTTWGNIQRPAGGEPFDLAWAEMAERLATPKTSPETPKGDLPALCLGSFGELTEARARGLELATWGPNYRREETLQAVHGLALDLDNPSPADGTPEGLREVFGRWAFLAHTTASHTPEAPRWRVLLPLARSVTPQEGKRLTKGWAPHFCAKFYAHRHGGAVKMRKAEPGEQGNAKGKVPALDELGQQIPLAALDGLPPAQGMYVPKPTPHYEHLVNEGRPLDPAEALAELAFWEQAEAAEKEKAEAAERLGEEGKRAAVALAKWTELGALDATWLTAPPPKRPTLLRLPGEGGGCLLPRGKVALLVGPGGTGKSQALADLAVAVASGGKWLETYPVEAPGRVLLAYGEEDLEEAQRRLHWTAQTAGLLPDARGSYAAEDAPRRLELLRRNLALLPLYGCAVPLPDAGTGGLSAFAEYLFAKLEAAGPWTLVILDPGARFMGADAEKDNAAATLFVEIVEQITQLPGAPAVVVAHHTNKAALASDWTNQGAARGSSAFVDGARWVCNLESVALHVWCAHNKAEREEAARDVLRTKLGGKEGERIRFLRAKVVKTNYSAHPPALMLANWTGTLRAATPVQEAALKEALTAALEWDPDPEKRAQKRAKREARARARDGDGGGRTPPAEPEEATFPEGWGDE